MTADRRPPAEEARRALAEAEQAAVATTAPTLIKHAIRAVGGARIRARLVERVERRDRPTRLPVGRQIAER